MSLRKKVRHGTNFNSSTWETKAGGFPSKRSAWFTEFQNSQSYRKTLFPKPKNKKSR